MEVANLDLCKELSNLSAWSDTYMVYGRSNEYKPMQCKPRYLVARVASFTCHYPAYDLSYLLQKLPKKIVIKKAIYGLVMTPATSDGSWIADYYSGGWEYFDDDRERNNWLHRGDRAKLTEASTPEDAVVKLCSQLFEQGILKKEEL